MSSKEITDLLLVIQAATTLLIAVRAFFLYRRTYSDILFSLTLSMGVIALGGILGLINDTVLTSATYNTFWFRFVGQTVGYLFIFLSSLGGSERYIQVLKRWHLVATALLLVLLFLTPLIPTNVSPVVTTALSGSRGVVCMAVFFSYTAIFLKKEARFSFLMSLAFLLISVGIWVYTMRFLAADALLLSYVGDSIRVAGLATMLIAFFAG